MTTVETKPRADTRLDEVRWTRRPVLAWTVRLALVAAPLVVSIALAWSLTALSPQPAGLVAAAIRWLVIASISSAALVALERFARRLLPIAALLDLTLAFPDQAPSRFKVALRTGTTGQLAQRIAEVRSEAIADPSVGSAQRVIELVAALRVHDRITRGHSERVRAYTQMIADEMGLPEDERERLRWAGLLHDVGKLLVPTSILNKVGRLTPEEYEIIKSHPDNGRLIIEDLVPWLGDSARAVWEHHEKWDGTGYPRGLAGEEISLAARIVAVADVYDVMTSARSYKDPVTPKQARAELARCAGSHFDPDVVRAFLNISLGRVRRAAGPLSWLAQLALFPTAAIGSTQAAGSAVVLTGALTASSAGIGSQMAADTIMVLDPRETASWAGSGHGSGDAVPVFDGYSVGVPDAVVDVAAPPRVIIESPATITRASAESFDIIVVQPASYVQAATERPGPPEKAFDADSPAAAQPPSTATTFAAITTIPPAVAAPPPPPTTTPTRVPLTTPTTTVRPGTTVPGTTVSGTAVPPTTLPAIEAPPPTSPSRTVPTPPVTLPNGRPGPVTTIPANPLSTAADRVASAAGPPRRADPGADARADDVDTSTDERGPSPQRP